MKTRALRVVQLCGLNAVPAWGFFGDGWSSGTTLMLYWSENLVAALCIGVRIALHRWLAKKRGHDFSVHQASRKLGEAFPIRHARPWSFLTNFLAASIVFTLAQGLFLGVIFFMLSQKPQFASTAIDFSAWREGFMATLGFLALGLAVDAVAIADKPFAWLRHMAEIALGRVVLIHFVVMIGVFLMVFFNLPTGMFAVFMTFKILADLGSLFGTYVPKETPPRWMAAVFDKMEKKDGQSFSEFWRESQIKQREWSAEDERLL